MQRSAARLEDGCAAMRRSAARLRSYGVTLVESASCASFLAATSCVIFSFLYLWKITPTLDLVCTRGPMARGADWLLFVALVVCMLALFVCCFDKPFRITRHAKTALVWILPSALFASTVRAIVLAILHPGWCTFFEFLWCLSFSIVVTAMHFEVADSVRRAAGRGPTAAQVEAVVAAVIGKLGGEPPEVDAECGECAAPCPICLCEWELEDSIRTTPCGHTYHEECLKNWLMRQTLSHGAQSCAVCRQDLRPDGNSEAGGEAPPRSEAGGEAPAL